MGTEDNFFEAGGNSLLLMRVMSRINAEVGGSLTRVEMFSYPTVRALARHLRAGAPGVVGQRPRRRRPRLPALQDRARRSAPQTAAAPHGRRGPGEQERPAGRGSSANGNSSTDRKRRTMRACEVCALKEDHPE
ncbi:phosphopantetheine-binding protein [Streptomyces sp. M19]